MTAQVTLELPEALAQQAKAVASHNQQRWEDVLLEWLTRAAAELPVELLSDEQVLNLCDLQLEPPQQDRLSELLSAQRESKLVPPEQIELAELMQRYRHGMVRKAAALKVAVERSLKPTLNR
ncbi:MAG: hypothetical protein HC910_22505 [Spirulinaceae cyanobacterium SM2_1_0]|nr:hypothetical protein [Spirulinaceae cyanobacterium SM2_1_0]